MYPQTHFLLPFFIAEILVKLNILNHEYAILTGLIGVFIDIDHFIKFAVYHKDFNVKHAWNTAVVKHESERTFIHHKTGFFLITIFNIILFFLNRTMFWVISLAYYSHMILDMKLDAKKILNIKEKGFIINLPVYELILDLLLVIGVVLLIII